MNRRICSILVLTMILFNLGIPDLFAENGITKESIVDGNNAFAFDLYKNLKSEKGNLFFSPFSISTALAMTYAGARANTEKQMAQVLHFSLDQGPFHPEYSKLIKEINQINKKGNCQINTANALWPQEGYEFLKAFVDIARTNYDAEVRNVDYASKTEEARQAINKWVEQKTNDKIKELIKPKILDPLVRLVLTNAIYFKGKWASQFKKESTKDMPFSLETGEEVKVPMMSQAAKFKYAEDDDIQVLEMPYIDDELSMIVFLPKQIDGLPKLEESFTKDGVKNLLAKLHPTEVEVYFPRFKMTKGFSLGDVLKEMGMADAFGFSADFSGMEPRKELYISRVIHQGFIDVNEEGTEAAAATAVVMSLKSVAIMKPVFKADHPFIYIIRENSSASILFMGRVTDPR